MSCRLKCAVGPSMPSPISAPTAPSWPRLTRIPIQPGVTYHSIIPLIDGNSPIDGVVEYRSSHLDGAASERIFPGTHFSQQDPIVTPSWTGFSATTWRHQRPRSLRQRNTSHRRRRVQFNRLARSRRARRSVRRRVMIATRGVAPVDAPDQEHRRPESRSRRRTASAAFRRAP